MKKVIIAVVCLVVLVSSAYASDSIKLVTPGVVLSEVAPDGSVLVNIQGHAYAVEDTNKLVLLKLRLKIGDNVLVVFQLGEDDRLNKLYISEKI